MPASVKRAPRSHISDSRSAGLLNDIAAALEIDRDVLPSSPDIRELCTEIIPDVLDSDWLPTRAYPVSVSKLCVALATGSLNSVINIGWNIAVRILRRRARWLFRNIALPESVQDRQRVGKNFIMADYRLVQLCYEYGLITEKVKVALDDCRNKRNKASDAHPTTQTITAKGAHQFLNKCLGSVANKQGNRNAIDMVELISDIHEIDPQEFGSTEWHDAFTQTYPLQQCSIIAHLHGLYCECGKDKSLRKNITSFCRAIHLDIPDSAISMIKEQHNFYLTEENQIHHRASCHFFSRLGRAEALSQSDMHDYVADLCSQLMTVHQEFDNFHNERRWASTLADLVVRKQVKRPFQFDLVQAIVTCAVGNRYGTSYSAYPQYLRIISRFSRENVDMMLRFPTSDSLVGQRIRTSSRCKRKFRQIVGEIPETRVSKKSLELYRSWSDL